MHLIHPRTGQKKFANRTLLPWHSLNETCPKMVVSNCDLHPLISYIRVAVTQQHHLFGIFSRLA